MIDNIVDRTCSWCKMSRYYSYWDRRTTVARFLEKEGWQLKNKNWLCPECVQKAHDRDQRQQKQQTTASAEGSQIGAVR